MAIKLTDAEKGRLETEQGVPFNFEVVEKLIDDRLEKAKVATEKTLNCLCCGEILNFKLVDNKEIYYCDNGVEDDEDEGENNAYDNCEEYGNEYNLAQLTEKYAEHIEYLQDKYNDLSQKYYISKNKLESVEKDIASKTFNGRVQAIVNYYWKVRQYWIYSHCKHTPRTYVSNGGESWETTCTKCGLLIDED